MPADSDAVVQPMWRDHDGRRVYDVSEEMLVKELPALGVAAALTDPPESRLFHVKQTAWPDVVLTVVINLGCAGAVEAVQALVHRRAAHGAGGTTRRKCSL